MDTMNVMGLSPRLRGNGDGDALTRSIVRSIPALAGERTIAISNDMTVRVYPRACGGTISNQGVVGDHQGLSPRLRGNVSLS